MRHKPTSADYKGLTIVLSNPSRHDSVELLSGTAGWKFWESFDQKLLKEQCDIRTSDTISEGLIPGTSALLLLGEKSMKEWTGGRYNNYTIHEQRGCPLLNDWKISCCIASYFPQDCVDMQDYEQRLNPLSERAPEDNDNAPEDDDFVGQKRKGKTARQNWGFWLERDIRKLMDCLPYNFSLPESPFVKYDLYANLEEVCDLLGSTVGKDLYLDIETDDLLQLRCVGFSFGLPNIYVVPIIRYDYSLAYGNRLAQFLGKLSIALNRNRVVVHNSMFDLFVLAWRYGIPIGWEVYDTMLAWHRCFPEVEKSLGHCVSALTWQPYHKDEIVYCPLNSNQDRLLWQYNGKDVYTMILVKQEIEKYASRIQGLNDSILQVNSSVYPYIVNTLFGLNFNRTKLEEQRFNNDRKMEQLLRIIRIFTAGHDLLPTSSASCVRYFHGAMGYKVVGRVKGRKKDGTSSGNPSLDEKNMWKLKLRYPQQDVIDLCIEYRRLSKETGTMKFEPWDIDNKLAMMSKEEE